MKRDMDLVRKILSDIEACDDIDGPLVSLNDPHAAYQAAILKEAGLVEATISTDGFGRPVFAIVIRLTWAGHDFLDSTKDSEIWKMAKEHIIKPGVSWTFQILVEWLKAEGRRRFFGGLTSSCSSTSPHVV
jgi:hypothetical protein